MSDKQSIVDVNNLTSVGTVRDAFGLKGEVFIALRGGAETPWLEAQAKIKANGPMVVILRSPEGQVKKFDMTSYRPHKNGVVVRLNGINDRTQAEALRKWVYLLDPEMLEAPIGEQPYVAELIGMEVIRDTGQSIGTVQAVEVTPQWDVLVVKSDAGEVDIPFLEAWVIDMNFEQGRITMQLQDEFLDPDFWKAQQK